MLDRMRRTEEAITLAAAEVRRTAETVRAAVLVGLVLVVGFLVSLALALT